jgi:hypothetical protein
MRKLAQAVRMGRPTQPLAFFSAGAGQAIHPTATTAGDKP